MLPARGTDLLHPFFSNFLFTNLFSIKFLYFFIISSLFPYFNLFVSIFIQSYVNICRPYIYTNNTQGMQLGRFKNCTPARFEYMYCTLFTGAFYDSPPPLPSTLKTTREESKMSNFHTILFQNSFVLVS